MSDQNVEVVKRLFPPPGTDYTKLFGDDTTWAAARAFLHRFVAPDFGGAFFAWGQEQAGFTGVDGMRAAWLEWLTPWTSYYDEIEDVLAVGDDRVLALARERGRRLDSGAEVVSETAAVYWVRDGKIARVQYYATRPDAFAAAEVAVGAGREGRAPVARPNPKT